MKTQYYTCQKCNRRYGYNADIGYSRDNICGPYCDGLLRGEKKSEARIKELEAELARLREQTQWRPIETAPKDGETIIAVEQATASNKTFLGRRVVTSIYWEDYWKNSYSDGRVENGMWEVILWQPFPLPPQAQENERE